MLTHVNEKNLPKMVDISHKQPQKRVAIAEGELLMNEQAFLALEKDEGKKGAISQTAVVGAIMGAKKASEIIAMCHQIQLQKVEISLSLDPKTRALKIRAEVACTEKTGAEMEALSAVSAGLLNAYDMLKALDKNMKMQEICVVKKAKIS